ncbi:hypothetical protein J27TS8_38660 [Robertmurraya siralis]|uniref:Transposase n=1 Tax=Robertmurraya siralis TaxID=77777 RepID=A0A920BVF8_9BACI|nr:hypothetical protein J27TS8_38660 [Robertmurraya siralis]
MFKNNQHKYSISAMCKVLQIPRSTYYYEAKERASEDDITSDVIDVFKASRQNYGTRKIKVELKKHGLTHYERARLGFDLHPSSI